MKNIFLEITDKILQYEDGDIIALSEMIDSFLTLKREFHDELLIKIVEVLIQLSHKKLDNVEIAQYIQIITGGVDILQEIFNEQDEGRKQYLSGKGETFIKEYEDTTTVKKEETQPESAQTSYVNVNSDVIKIFIAEAEERIARAQDFILKLEENSSDAELINELFRIFHTIKGECGFLKIASLGELAHNIENLFDLIRNKKLKIDSTIIDVFLEGIDLAKNILKELKNGEVILINRTQLDKFIDTLLDVSKSARHNIGDILKQEGKLSDVDVVKILNKQKESSYTKKFGEIAVEENFISEDELKESLGSQQNIQKKGETEQTIEKIDPIIKVKSSKVNYLVDMIGELLIASGQINDLSPAYRQVQKIIKSLQYAAMDLRTETVKNLFGNIKRVIRDVCKKLNKQVVVSIIGDDLEIDRNLIEKLEEPLIHLARNAVHHGIESGEVRLAHKKTAEGHITIEAERKGNNIVISIMDDGQGLNRAKILEKAVEKQVIKESDRKALTDNDVYNLIFIQGFSTAEKIDYVSGRGVGMDIVKSVVTAAKGKVEIETVSGEFTKFFLVFPLSTAIIDGMVVRIEGNDFIIPIASIVESIKIKPEMISYVQDKIRVLHLRQEVMPVIDLKAVLRIKNSKTADLIGVIVENSEKKKFIFIVDAIIAKREVVIKSLGKKFRDLKGISSGTVLAGGKIGLVLDVDQIVDASIKEEVL